MPASIPVHNTMIRPLLVGTILSSVVYGISWLQVYSYYNSHFSRDRWPLRSFVAFLVLVDSADVAFVIQMNYHICVTNFGDYQANLFVPCLPKLTKSNISPKAVALSGFILEVSVEHFYAYRIYRLTRGSPYMPVAISAVSSTSFGIGILYFAKILEHIHIPGIHFLGFAFSTLSCKVACDLLITVGMVFTLLNGHTQVRRTNNVLNLLTIYAINCGALNFVCYLLTHIARHVSKFAPIRTILLLMIRLYFCAFMSILNSRDYLRQTLDGPEGVAALTQLKAHIRTTVPCTVRVTTQTCTNAAAPKILQPVKVSSNSDASFSDSALGFNREKYPVPPAPSVFTAKAVDIS